MNLEGMRKESRTTRAGIQKNVAFGGRISAWAVCDEQRFWPSLNRRTREEEKLLTVRNSASSLFHNFSRSGDDARNGLPI